MKIKYAAVSIVLTIISSQLEAQTANWVRDNTWYFTNFDGVNIGWDLFRQSFIGVAPTQSDDGTFDQLFYKYMYLQLFPPGDCYGIDVLALQINKNGGSMGFCKPVYIYPGDHPYGGSGTGPTDTLLRRAIEITHAYQINYGFLTFLLNVIGDHNNRDGRYAAQQIQYYLAQNDPPILSVSTSLFPGGCTDGHVLIPYQVEPDGSGGFTIYVYNPNVSYYDDTTTYYSNGRNVVNVDNTGKWSFYFGSCDKPNCAPCNPLWSGDPSSGGNLIAVPLSVAGHMDRLPQSLLADATKAVNTFFIFGENTSVRQITDPESKRHYMNEAGTDIEADTTKYLANILPFIPLGSGNVSDSIKVYFVRGNKPVDFEIQAVGKYHVVMIFGGKCTELDGYGDGSISTICMCKEKYEKTYSKK